MEIIRPEAIKPNLNGLDKLIKEFNDRVIEMCRAERSWVISDEIYNAIKHRQGFRKLLYEAGWYVHLGYTLIWVKRVADMNWFEKLYYKVFIN